MNNRINFIHRRLARLKKWLFKKNYWQDKGYPSFWFDHVLGDKVSTIVQIGSNDGKTGDPLYNLLIKNNKWHGLFVEPVPSIFEKLKANYTNDSRFKFENSAINEGKVMPFFTVSPNAIDHLPDLPLWYDQLGSFDKDHIEKQLNGILKPFISEIEIEGITLNDLFIKHDVIEIDILHIDAEGYDWKILSQLDLDKTKPKFILFESQHLSPEELSLASAKLSPYYVLYQSGIDTLATSKLLSTEILSKIKKNFKKN